jgi:predicted dienelactone hydrolase
MTFLLFVLSVGALHQLSLQATQVVRRRVLLASLLLFAVLMSWWLDGWRWPRAALWLWALWLGWMLLSRPPADSHILASWRRRLLFAGGIFVSYCALNLAQLTMASQELPALSGPYPVARHQWLVRSPRPDLHNPDPFARREFPVDVYYPTRVNEQMRRVDYWSTAMLQTGPLQHLAALPAFFFQHEASRLQAQSWDGFGSGLSAAQPKYPVVIFSPGLGLRADMHTFHLEQLASHGYVVFAITHPGQTDLARAWSARSLTEDRAAWQRREAHYEAASVSLSKTLDESGAVTDKQLRDVMAFNAVPLRSYPLAVRKDDVIELLDRLQSLNEGAPASQFAARLDLQRIAVTGMSYGGPTAADVCLEDARCKVVVNMDGEEFGALPLASGTRPALWLYRMGRWEGTPLRRVAYQRYSGPAYRVGFHGARHSTFTDQPFWPPEARAFDVLLPSWLFDRRQRAEQALALVILEYELDFLDHYLQGSELQLLNGAQIRSDAVVDSRNTAGVPLSLADQDLQ